jgi:hypothetical protein
MMKRLVVLFAFALLVPAGYAQGAAVTSYGVRAGLSIDPDQIVLGGQLSVGDVAPNLTFDPNVEFGFGDDVTVIAFNLDMHYHFDINGSQWRPYVGVGAGINLISIDLPPGFAGDDSFTEVGANFIFGASVPTRAGNQFFGEMKLGVGDIPELKLLVGWNFRSY